MNAGTLLPGSPRPLCAALAAVFAIAPLGAAAIPQTWTVTNCDEGSSGDEVARTGSLRFVTSKAASGDIVDMTQLVCSQITLATGAIQIAQNNLRIDGPGTKKLVISGKYEQDRIFRHTGTGTLQISDLSMTGGYFKPASGSARGGCVFSAGTAILDGVRALYCTTKSQSLAAGGAVYATTGLIVKGGSLISQNTGDGGTSGDARGGGLFARSGSLLVEYSTVSDNQLLSINEFCSGGGIYGGGSATIKHATVSGNYSCWVGGGILLTSQLQYAANALSIGDSTISGNVSRFYVGGIWADSGTVDVRNTTIVRNESGRGFVQQFHAGTGLNLIEKSPNTTVTIDSSIIADNFFDTTENDLELSSYGVGFNGSHNLIGSSSDPLPADTITGVCPQLGPLRDNGGLTPTHALLGGSPAIDSGQGNLQAYEQRGRQFVNGKFDYQRVSGPHADIGAYEVQQGDEVFNTGFDGCVALP